MRVLLPLVTLWVVLACPVAAAIELPTVRLSPRPELLIVQVLPAPGTHLAADLPLRAGVADGYFTFEVNEPSPPSAGPGRLRLPLMRERRIESWTVTVQGAACADDGTTCQPFHVVADLARGSLRATLSTEPGRLRAAEPAPPTAEPPKPPQRRPTTSIRPVILDFFATWCPPCDRLRDEFLEHPDWAEFLADYEVRSIDADDPSSFALKDRYRVGGYPTVILTNPAGETLERIVGFPGAEQTADRLRVAPRSPSPLQGENCAALLPGLRVAVAQERQSEAWAALQDGCSEADLRAAGALPFAFELATAVEAEDFLLPYALAALLAEDDVGRVALLANSAVPLLLAAGRENEAAQVRASVVRMIDEALDADLTPEARISLADALYYRGGWEPDGGWHAEAAAMLARAITDRAGAPPGPVPDAVLALNVTLRHHEGLVHDLVYLLRAAENHSAVGRLYGAMLTLFPESFTWHYAQAGWLLEQGAADKAEPAARRALTYAYGDMALRASQRLATVLQARGDTDGAVAVIDDALLSPQPAEKHVRTWRYREALMALRDELSPPGPR